MSIWVALVGGFILLAAGGEFLVRGAVQVAHRLHVSPLVISLTLVGFGTSTPELVTSVDAALRGSPGIAYGNIVGSNIANTLLILGASAVWRPIFVSSVALRRDGMVMLLAVAGFAALVAVMPMTRSAGAVFVAGLAAYIFMAYRQERRAQSDHGAAYGKAAAKPDPAVAHPGRSLFVSLLISVTGLALVFLGGHLLVAGAVDLARSLAVSETVIGLTIVAVGTSLPELVTSVVAAIRKQSDIAFGNIIGSSIYNVLGIGGVTGLIAPAEVPAEIVRFDNPVMICASFLVIGLAYTGRRVSRWEGLLLLTGYAAYLTWSWSS